jgi:hypothetical protein
LSDVGIEWQADCHPLINGDLHWTRYWNSEGKLDNCDGLPAALDWVDRNGGEELSIGLNDVIGGLTVQTLPTVAAIDPLFRGMKW